MPLFLALVFVAIVLGFIGAFVKGLFYLVTVGVMVFVVAVTYLFLHRKRSGRIR